MSIEDRNKAWECGLPGYLQRDLDAYKEGLRTNSTLLDCLWCELYGSINGAEINDQAITHEHAQYLRREILVDTYAAYIRPEIALYYQSSGYIYEYLLRELRTGKLQ